MPWSAKDAARHSKTADPAKWSAIANAILKREGEGSEGKAIRIANSKAKKGKK